MENRRGFWYHTRAEMEVHRNMDDTVHIVGRADTANGRRIAVNAAVMCAQGLLALVSGLFSARWVSAALGPVDLGLYAMVGSMMAFVSFFSGVLGISVARHYAYAVGGGDQEDLAAWCAAAFRIHLVLAFVLTALAGALGEWCARNVPIPPERLAACLWTFRLSLLTIFVTVATVPFNAMYIAHQRFGKLAAFGLVQTAVMFCGAWWLFGAGCDRLIAYAGYMTLAFAGVAVAQTVGVLIEFPVCRHPMAAVGTGGRIRSLLSFAGWSMFGTGGGIVGTQGSALVRARLFDVATNAAYGVATHVSTQVQHYTGVLANALVRVFEPAVTSQEGAGKRDVSVQLACRAGLFGASLLALFALPLLLELPTVLALFTQRGCLELPVALVLWPENVPADTALVCAISLFAATLNTLTKGQQLALNACGRIAGWQVAVGVGRAVMLPVAVTIAFCGGGVVSAVIAAATAMAICAALNVWFGWRRAGLGVGLWLRTVVVPFVSVVGLGALAGLLPRLLMAPGFLRVQVTSCATSLVFEGAALMWWLRPR